MICELHVQNFAVRRYTVRCSGEVLILVRYLHALLIDWILWDMRALGTGYALDSPGATYVMDDMHAYRELVRFFCLDWRGLYP